MTKVYKKKLYLKKKKINYINKLLIYVFFSINKGNR